MRKVFCLMAAAAIVLAGCKKENEETPVKDPEIKLTSTEDITVPHEGGTAAIAYEIVNPVDGGIISAASQADWISDFNYDTEGEVTFTVAANTVTEKRNATVTLTYTYWDGKTVKAEANLVQDAYIEVPDPEIKIEESEMTVPAEGGQSEIAIEILNPAEDGSISAEADADWITVTSTTETSVIFDVAENTETDSRESIITVIYTYGDGETSEKQVTVKQNGKIPDPELYIDMSSITVPAEGGQTSFAIEVINPAQDGSISTETDVNWITVTESSETSVTFSTQENTITEAREGVITVIYTYDDNKTLEKQVTVTQDAKIPDPELFIDLSSITVPAEGGQTSFAIEVINPAQDGNITAETDANWITVTSATSTSIIFSADENTETSAREGRITITYTYDGGKVLTGEITVSQEAAAQSSAYDYEYVLVKAEGSYWTSGYNSYITFCDTDYSVFNEPNAVFYKFDIYSDGPNNRLPTAGTYTYNRQSYVSMTFGHQSSSTTAYDESGREKYLIKFADGTLTISYEGDNMVMEGFLTDENGATHHITYNGPKPTL